MAAVAGTHEGAQGGGGDPCGGGMVLEGFQEKVVHSPS